MNKYKVNHPDIGIAIDVYRVVDIQVEYKFEIKKGGIWSACGSTKKFNANVFAACFGVRPFLAQIGCGRPSWCVPASKFDEYACKNNWRTDDEHGCGLNRKPEPEPGEDHHCFETERSKHASEFSVELVRCLDRLLATLFDAKFKEGVRDIGKSIADELLRELPALMFNQMQNAISKMIEIKIAGYLDKATDPKGVAQ